MVHPTRDSDKKKEKVKGRPRCSFTNCIKPVKAKKLCTGHLEQRRVGKELTALVPKRSKYASLVRNEKGEKWCPSCSSWLESSLFTNTIARLDGKYFHCVNCERGMQLLMRYGITKKEFDDILASQDNKCAICGTSTPRGRGWCVDHDHSCCGASKGCRKCIRGVLCSVCNTGIGLFGDNPTLLEKAVWYLKREIEKRKKEKNGRTRANPSQ